MLINFYLRTKSGIIKKPPPQEIKKIDDKKKIEVKPPITKTTNVQSVKKNNTSTSIQTPKKPIQIKDNIEPIEQKKETNLKVIQF